MKRGLIKAAWLIVWGGVVSYLLMHVTYVLRTDTEEKRNLMGFYYEEEESLDAVFIGSSGLRSCINPLAIYEEYGITSYVIATAAQRPSSLYYLLKEARKTQPEAVFFIDVSTAQYDNKVWEEQNEGSVRRVTDGLKYSLNRIACNYEQTKGREDLLPYYFDIIKYHSEWRNFCKNLSHWNFELENPNKGLNLLFSATPQDAFIWQEETAIPLCKESEQTLRKLLKYCKENKIDAEFTLPVSAYFTYGQAEYIRELVESYGYELFVFNDYLQEMQIDSMTDFYDVGHLNIRGVQKASSYFGKYIFDKYFLSDRNKEPNYASWDASLECMKKKLELGEFVMRVGELEVVNQVKDNNEIILSSQTSAAKGAEFAWYVCERNNPNEEWIHIYTQWYTPSAELVYAYDPGKCYQITRYVRAVEDENIVNEKIVANLHFDGEEWSIN